MFEVYPNTGSSGIHFPQVGPFSGNPSSGTPVDISKPLDPSQNPLNTDGEIASKVKNSVAYQQAHAILSQESNPLWLQRLEAIPYSVDDAYQTRFDKIHWSNKYEDKQDANYQYCMEQISALMQEYQSWKNSLPAEQVNQLSQAGINSAVTGQSISGSEIPDVGVATNPSALESTNVGDVVLGAANFMLTAVGGFADLASKFAQLGLSRKSFLSDINKYAREHGIRFQFSEKGETRTRDFRSWSDFRKPFIAVDPQGRSIDITELFNASKAFGAYGPVIAHAIKTDPNFADEFLESMYNAGNGDMLQVGGLHIPESVALDATVRAQYDLHKASLDFTALKEQYNVDISKYTAESAEYKATTDKYNRDVAGFNKQVEQIKTTLIETLHKSNHPDDKLLLCKILNGQNYSDIEILKQAAHFAEANAAVGLLKGLIPFTQSGN